MASKIFQDYFESKKALDILQKEVDSLKDQLIAEIQAAPEQRVELPGLAKFSLGVRKTWEYSSDVILMDGKVKQLKKLEEKNGTAKVVQETIFPSMKNLKNE